jgi:pimeloyl-ACP methyl ester carboxylesterase
MSALETKDMHVLTGLIHRLRRLINASVVVAGVLVSFGSGVEAHEFEALPYYVDEDSLEFSPLAGAKALWGVSERGAGYQIEMPKNWNGGLLVSLRGNGVLCEPETGQGCALEVSPNQLRGHAIKNGFAWATSSYSDFRLFPEEHAADVVELVELFKSRVAEPRRSYVWGKSFGGVTTLAVIQLHPDLFDGAMPVCTGVVQDGFGSYFELNFVAMALVAEEEEHVADYLDNFSFPIDTQYYRDNIVPRVLAGLGESFPHNSNANGLALRDFVRANSGGTRPMFEVGFDALAATIIAYYMDISFPLDHGAMAPIENRAVQYRFETAPGEPLSKAEVALNERIPRFGCDPGICRDGQRQGKESGLNGGLTRISGDLPVPVLHLQELGDLTAPFAGAVTLAERVKAQGKSNFLVQRGIRSALHCDFNDSELEEGFDDLVAWVEGDRRPSGDDFLSGSKIADPEFGCVFTKGPHKLDADYARYCEAGNLIK